MASSPGCVRSAHLVEHTLSDSAFDALREAVFVADTRLSQFPLIMANAVARRCVSGDSGMKAISGLSLHALLDPGMHAILPEVLASLVEGQSSVTRVVTWRLSMGTAPLPTEFKALRSDGQLFVMACFADPLTEHESLSATTTGDGTSDVLMLDKALTVTYANSGAVRRAELTQDAILGQSAMTVTPTAVLPREVLIDALEGIGYRADALPARCPGRAPRWFAVDVQPLHTRSDIIGLIVRSKPVVEHTWSRLARGGQQRSMPRNRQRDFITVAGKDGNLLFVSGGIHSVLGYEPKIWLGQNLFQLIHPYDAQKLRRRYLELVTNDKASFTAHCRISHADGTFRGVEAHFVAAFDHSSVNGVVCDFCDVTARTPQNDGDASETHEGESSGASEHSHELIPGVDIPEKTSLTQFLSDTQRVARLGGWEYLFATDELRWTRETYGIYETTASEFEVTWHSMMSRCSPESKKRLDEAIDDAKLGENRFALDLEISTLQERCIYIHVTGQTERREGRPHRAYGSVQDIHERKHAQQALERSTDWLKRSLSMAHMHGWRWDRSTDALQYANADGHMRDLPRVLPSMKQLLRGVHPNDRLAVRQAMDHAFEHHTEGQVEFRLRSRAGPYRSYLAMANPLFDASGEPSALSGVIQDVTAHRESDLRVQRSEELLRTTTAHAADVLLLVDRALNVRFINRAVQDLSVLDIVGREISVLIPQDAREDVMGKLREVLTTGTRTTFDYTVTRDGETRHFEGRAVSVGEDWAESGLSIAICDYTERKRLEREILDVSARERHAIGRDLHDGLGQELTGVSLMLRSLASHLEQVSPESLGRVNEIADSVKQSIETARSLARGLLPVNTEGGLPAALQKLAERNRELYGIQVECRMEVLPTVKLSEATASHLYRIAQETLTNAVRHGHATSVTLLLTVTEQRFQLWVADNGIGLAQTRQSGEGMGLKIMKYRASMIGAMFEIVPNYPTGTVVRVTGHQAMPAGASLTAQVI